MEPSIDTRNLPAVCYTPEMDVARCMPAKNDMLAVQFLTTVAIINRRGDGLYTITTAPNPIPETPGNGSCRGTYADLAMGKALGSTGDYKHTQDMLEAGLSADQVNQCLGAIGDMLVNTQSFHDSELNRRDERTTL